MEVLFWTSFALLGWCFAGYPLAMVIRARVAPRPVRSGGPPGHARISVILAVRNGEGYIARRLDNLLSQREADAALEILVLCNGCVDRTEAIARETADRDPRVRVLVSPAELGKAGALNLGVGAAGGDIVVFADVRQLFAPDAVRRLLEPFGDPEVGAVTGRLVIRKSEEAAVEGVRWYWELETLLRSAEGRTGSVIGATGAVYAIRRHLYAELPPNLILDDVFLPMRIAMQGARVVMAEGAVAYDIPSDTRGLEFQRKRRTMVGNLQLLRVMPGLLSPARNPALLRFLSHKLLRLATPFCLLSMVGAAALLPGPSYQAFFLAAVLMYAVGLVGLVAPLPLASIASAVVLMHGAIFSAFWNFRRDAASVWTPTPPRRSAADSTPPV